MNLQAFEKVLKSEGLHIAFSPDWVDSKSIRKALHTLPTLTDLVGGIERINLEVSPPVISGSGAISVSHSNKGGVILVSKSRFGIGVDLEEDSRLSESVIKRVSTEKERASAPNPKYLWPAKEASFKTLYPNNQNLAIPQMTIQIWDEISPNVWFFQSGFELKAIKGFLFTDGILLVAAAKVAL